MLAYKAIVIARFMTASAHVCFAEGCLFFWLGGVLREAISHQSEIKRGLVLWTLTSFNFYGLIYLPKICSRTKHKTCVCCSIAIFLNFSCSKYTDWTFFGKKLTNSKKAKQHCFDSLSETQKKNGSWIYSVHAVCFIKIWWQACLPY